METRSIRPEPPLIVILGPTASGKTSLAIKIAQKYNGEIICADSRTVYKHMDIGTAKPTQAEQNSIPHWGLDLVNPGERFTAADFKQYAMAKIAEIRARGHIPLLAGGTGLYIDAVLFDYNFNNTYDKKLREQLEEKSISQLHDYCIKNNISLPENNKNKRYVIRAIEQKNVNNSKRHQPISNSIVVGISTNKDILRNRIEQRTEQIFTNGVVNEALNLAQQFGWDSEAMTGNVYRLVHEHIEGHLPLAEVKSKNTIADWQLAKRQLTWFRRNPSIYWASLEQAERYLAQRLAN